MLSYAAEMIEMSQTEIGRKMLKAYLPRLEIMIEDKIPFD